MEKSLERREYFLEDKLGRRKLTLYTSVLFEFIWKHLILFITCDNIFWKDGTKVREKQTVLLPFSKSLFAQRSLSWGMPELHSAGTLQTAEENSFLSLCALSMGMRQHELSEWKSGVIQALLAFCHCEICSLERGTDGFLYILWQKHNFPAPFSMNFEFPRNSHSLFYNW